MSIKTFIAKKAAGNMADSLMSDMKKAQSESDKFIKQLNSELHELAELINQSLDSQNEIIKGNISIYQLLVKIAEINKVEIPAPLTEMAIK